MNNPLEIQDIGNLLTCNFNTCTETHKMLESSVASLIRGEIPGFNKVKISNSKLKTIINNQEKTWKGALSNIKGIYLITDQSNGKQYVGSATGNDGIWNRWASYSTDGHGGNVELKRVLKQDPDRYKQFQYSILEIADNHTSDQDIINRESFWKEVLGTRKFGYNAN